MYGCAVEVGLPTPLTSPSRLLIASAGKLLYCDDTTFPPASDHRRLELAVQDLSSICPSPLAHAAGMLLARRSRYDY